MYQLFLGLEEKGIYPNLYEALSVFIPELHQQLQSGVSMNVFKNTNAVGVLVKSGNVVRLLQMNSIDVIQFGLKHDLIKDKQVVAENPVKDESAIVKEFFTETMSGGLLEFQALELGKSKLKEGMSFFEI